MTVTDLSVSCKLVILTYFLNSVSFSVGCLLFLLVSCSISLLVCFLELLVFCFRTRTGSVSVWTVLEREVRCIVANKRDSPPSSNSCNGTKHVSNGGGGLSSGESPVKEHSSYCREPSVTDKLLSHKKEEERLENSRL